MKFDNITSFLMGIIFTSFLGLVMFFFTYLIHMREMTNDIRIVKTQLNDIHKSSSIAENYIIDKHKK